MPEPESSTRIAKGLAGLAKGVAALNRHPVVTDDDFEDVLRVALDCLPDIRRTILKAAMSGAQISAVKAPQTVCTREVENLRELGIIAPGAFVLSPDIHDLLKQAGCEIAVQPDTSSEQKPEDSKSDDDKEVVDVGMDGRPVYRT